MSSLMRARFLGKWERELFLSWIVYLSSGQQGVIFGVLFGDRLFDAGLAEGVPALDSARRVLGGVLLGAEEAEQLLLHRI